MDRAKMHFFYLDRRERICPTMSTPGDNSAARTAVDMGAKMSRQVPPEMIDALMFAVLKPAQETIDTANKMIEENELQIKRFSTNHQEVLKFSTFLEEARTFVNQQRELQARIEKRRAHIQKSLVRYCLLVRKYIVENETKLVPFTKYSKAANTLVSRLNWGRLKAGEPTHKGPAVEFKCLLQYEPVGDKKQLVISGLTMYFSTGAAFCLGAPTPAAEQIKQLQAKNLLFTDVDTFLAKMNDEFARSTFLTVAFPFPSEALPTAEGELPVTSNWHLNAAGRAWVPRRSRARRSGSRPRRSRRKSARVL